MASPRSSPYLHVVPGGLPTAPDAALQPQWGAQGSVLRVCAQPCAHIADLDEKEAERTSEVLGDIQRGPYWGGRREAK